jgi:hypothetical protein
MKPVPQNGSTMLAFRNVRLSSHNAVIVASKTDSEVSSIVVCGLMEV